MTKKNEKSFAKYGKMNTVVKFMVQPPSEDSLVTEVELSDSQTVVDSESSEEETKNEESKFRLKHTSGAKKLSEQPDPPLKRKPTESKHEREARRRTTVLK